jgi:hypothetical protein
MWNADNRPLMWNHYKSLCNLQQKVQDRKEILVVYVLQFYLIFFMPGEDDIARNLSNISTQNCKCENTN